MFNILTKYVIFEIQFRNQIQNILWNSFIVNIIFNNLSSYSHYWYEMEFGTEYQNNCWRNRGQSHGIKQTSKIEVYNLIIPSGFLVMRTQCVLTLVATKNQIGSLWLVQNVNLSVHLNQQSLVKQFRNIQNVWTSEFLKTKERFV